MLIYYDFKKLSIEIKKYIIDKFLSRKKVEVIYKKKDKI